MAELKYGNKNVKVVHITGTSLYALAFTSGGELPKELAGMWTSPEKAAAAVGDLVRIKQINKQAEAK